MNILHLFFNVHFSFIFKWVKVLGTDEPKVLEKKTLLKIWTCFQQFL